MEYVRFKGGLDLFYDDSGTGVRFAELFNELAEKIPPTKISQIQDLIKSKIWNMDGIYYFIQNLSIDIERIITVYDFRF